jgi:uncharacterized protein
MNGEPGSANAPAQALTDVASPCVDICRIDETDGLCVGCGRTLDEIAAWRSLDAPARRAVLDAVALRRAAR